MTVAETFDLGFSSVYLQRTDLLIAILMLRSSKSENFICVYIDSTVVLVWWRCEICKFEKKICFAYLNQMFLSNFEAENFEREKKIL